MGIKLTAFDVALEHLLQHYGAKILRVFFYFKILTSTINIFARLKKINSPVL
jgi:hypothetical protein